MSNEIVMSDVRYAQPANRDQNTSNAEEARVMQQVQLQVALAAKRPRIKEYGTIVDGIKAACERYDFAENAHYKVPRAGTHIEGLSIRAAEMFAQIYRNIEYAANTLYTCVEYSEVDCYCWDLENNVRRSTRINVPHYKRTKAKGEVLITDPAEIKMHVAAQSQKAVRQCILSIIPQDLIELAETTIKKTLLTGGKKSLEEQINDVVVAFADIGVSLPQLEKKLGKKINKSSVHLSEIHELRKFYQAIKSGYVTDVNAYLDGVSSEDKPAKQAAPALEKPKEQPMIQEAVIQEEAKDPVPAQQEQTTSAEESPTVQQAIDFFN